MADERYKLRRNPKLSERATEAGLSLRNTNDGDDVEKDTVAIETSQEETISAEFEVTDDNNSDFNNGQPSTKVDQRQTAVTMTSSASRDEHTVSPAASSNIGTEQLNNILQMLMERMNQMENKMSEKLNSIEADMDEMKSELCQRFEESNRMLEKRLHLKLETQVTRLVDKIDNSNHTNRVWQEEAKDRENLQSQRMHQLQQEDNHKIECCQHESGDSLTIDLTHCTTQLQNLEEGEQTLVTQVKNSEEFEKTKEAVIPQINNTKNRLAEQQNAVLTLQGEIGQFKDKPAATAIQIICAGSSGFAHETQFPKFSGRALYPRNYTKRLHRDYKKRKKKPMRMDVRSGDRAMIPQFFLLRTLDLVITSYKPQPQFPVSNKPLFPK